MFKWTRFLLIPLSFSCFGDAVEQVNGDILLTAGLSNTREAPTETRSFAGAAKVTFPLGKYLGGALSVNYEQFDTDNEYDSKYFQGVTDYYTSSKGKRASATVDFFHRISTWYKVGIRGNYSQSDREVNIPDESLVYEAQVLRDSGGNPILTSDGDFIPDYIRDAEGNPVFDGDGNLIPDYVRDEDGSVILDEQGEPAIREELVGRNLHYVPTNTKYTNAVGSIYTDFYLGRFIDLGFTIDYLHTDTEEDGSNKESSHSKYFTLAGKAYLSPNFLLAAESNFRFLDSDSDNASLYFQYQPGKRKFANFIFGTSYVKTDEERYNSYWLSLKFYINSKDTLRKRNRNYL